MEFFRKSIFRKFFLVLAVAAIVCATALYAPSTIPSLAPFQAAFSLGALFVALLAALVAFRVLVDGPLHLILKEMKALLAGKEYHRVYTERIDEWGVAGYFFNEVTKNVERISSTVREGERMSTELNIATDIQKMVLPNRLPVVPGLDIYVSTRPAAEVGGDNYDAIRSKGNTFLYVGDVTGHGVPAGLVMMMVNTLIDTFTEMYQSAYDVVVQTNRMLKPRIQSTMFMTMVMLRWGEVEKKMYAVGCGHEHILTFRQKTKLCDARQSGGIALGMIADNSKILKEEEIAFEVGDFLLLYSDGIPEAKNTSGEMFGLERLRSLVAAHGPASKNSQELFTKIMTDFSAYVEDQIQNDDITLMVIRRTE